ncbi:hypothetical protein F3K44_31160 [Bacillus megaterium]|nr:hypothetical protein [Priestia megaterium]
MNKDTSVIDIEYIFNVDLTYLFKRTDVQGKAAVSRAEGFITIIYIFINRFLK